MESRPFQADTHSSLEPHRSGDNHFAESARAKELLQILFEKKRLLEAEARAGHLDDFDLRFRIDNIHYAAIAILGHEGYQDWCLKQGRVLLSTPEKAFTDVPEPADSR